MDNIVEQGFDLGCSGALGEFKLGGLFEDRNSQKEVWKVEAKKFANVGLQIEKFLFGLKNLRTEEWEERCADPMRFYDCVGFGLLHYRTKWCTPCVRNKIE